jgi:hypothetical protein
VHQVNAEAAENNSNTQQELVALAAEIKQNSEADQEVAGTTEDNL